MTQVTIRYLSLSLRTSDILNAGLPIKNVKKEVTQKRLISVLPSAQKPYVGA